MAAPSRGDVWLVSLNPVRGREQAGTRPALIVAVDGLNRSPADLVIVIPITSRKKGVRSHVPTTPPEGGLRRESFIKCEDVRSISQERLARFLGRVSAGTMSEVEERLRVLLGL